MMRHAGAEGRRASAWFRAVQTAAGGGPHRRIHVDAACGETALVGAELAADFAARVGRAMDVHVHVTCDIRRILRVAQEGTGRH